MKSSSITNIGSIHAIKLIFSHLEYNRFFSLIKYNKEIQQNLKINFKENIHQNKYKERMTENELDDDYVEGYSLILGGVIYGIIYLFFFIHYLLNAILTIKLDPKLYKNNNTYWEIITNNLVKIFSIIFHFFTISILFQVLNNFSTNYTLICGEPLSPFISPL